MLNQEISEATSDEEYCQFLTFYMDNEEYGIDILSVQEIRGWEAATAIPNAPGYVKGVLNLRGTVVPIVDLRLRFGMNQAEYSALTVVIVVNVHAENGVKVMGIVVDAVSDVHSFALSDIQSSPELADNRNTSFVTGLGNINDKMVILLDINAMLTAQDDADFSSLRSRSDD
ncbi:MAG: chemotaxis protein CheW [Hahellaceae bacterium]|nr:chemotaxis protein CheW [Hahellaceae bacterium]